MNTDNLITVIIPLISALAVWFGKDKLLFALNIKKEEKTIENSQLENIQKALEVWQDMLDDVVKRHKLQVEELETIISKVKLDLAKLEKINENLEKMVIEQKEFIAKQSKIIELYKNKFGNIE